MSILGVLSTLLDCHALLLLALVSLLVAITEYEKVCEHAKLNDLEG